MEQTDIPDLMHQLIAGLNSLQNEYEKLFDQHRALEGKLLTARGQYNELAKLLGKSTTDTPPLSLASTSPACPKNEEQPLSTVQILELRNEHQIAQTLRTAIDASTRFGELRSHTSTGVKIWSGPSADPSAVSSKLPSISESPMEQDFTVVGVPSKLGCPFASMAGKKLSTHAASVLSRYNSQSPRDGQSVVRDTGSAVGSSVSKHHGRGCVQQNRSRRRSSMVDPIKAEICGLDRHEPDRQPQRPEDVQIEDADGTKEGEPGVCPIRFLNQHSPEELAQYFEKHKHELPRSHEVCVRRYQSNEQQVRELDAKYSDVAQMIRGLGEKHQNYLPKDLEDAQDGENHQGSHEVADDGRIEKWANNLAPNEPEPLEGDVDGDEGRQGHFSRPLRDVRLGESPSRPWGIQIPPQYLEKAASDASSTPVRIESSGALPAGHPGVSSAEMTKGAKCPFADMANNKDVSETERKTKPSETKPPAIVEPAAEPSKGQAKTIDDSLKAGPSQSVVFTGPIIIGYGPEEAARFLRNLARGQS